MYEREKAVLLASSASMISNNVCRLSMNGKMYAGVVHRGELNVVCPSAPDTEPRRVVAHIGSSSSIVATIMQASWVQVHDRALLVLATNAGALIYEWDGSVLLCAHLLPQPSPDAHASFCRGIAALYTGFICVGVHTGEIVVLSVEETPNGVIEEAERVRWHSRPITALASYGKVLVSGDDAGNITICEDKEPGLSRLTSIDSYGSPVTCLATWSGMVIAGYLSGHIRLHQLQDGKIMAEVCAHVRSITAVDVAQETGYMLSASEDTYVRVWELSNDPIKLIEHKYCSSEENAAVCGAAFSDAEGSGYVTAAYDRREIFCYAM
ncbi:WD repeat-containing protein 54-like [Macrobrachium rosenbergii]|uniref:WD repeat-containing protein 54-like n=1 Tax=Macrobrachium rosenbergii TaxID=79674 RepID=UPI0034D5DCE4